MDYLFWVFEVLYVGFCYYIGILIDLEVIIRWEVIDIDGKIRIFNFVY